jgi:hypothetical protein
LAATFAGRPAVMTLAAIPRRFRLCLWGLLAVGFAATIILSLVVWHRGEMADHGMWRTIGWASLGFVLTAFQYPCKRP